MNVMLSYRSTDQGFANQLVGYLQQRGIDPWIDREGIRPFAKWRDVLLQELRTCDVCVVVLSPEYLASEHCRMEVFIARSFGRLILPIMVKDCFPALRDHEETKGLEDIFMMRMYKLSAVGLPITEEDAFRRISDAILCAPENLETLRPVYISYSTHDGEFATNVARALAAKNIPTWVATLNVRVGENWRDAQARAMLQASAHVVVLDEAMVQQAVLRTEILLAEARGLAVFPLLPPRLTNQRQKIAMLLDSLNNSDQTYRRLAETQYLSWAGGLEEVTGQLSGELSRYVGPIAKAAHQE